MHQVTLMACTHFQDIFDYLNSSIEEMDFQCPKVVVKSGGPPLIAPGWKIIYGTEPYIGGRNFNEGAREIPEGDILSVSDDVKFLQPDTLELLSELAYSDPKIGLLSPVVHGGVGNSIQGDTLSRETLRVSRLRLAFICIYWKRQILEEIGPVAECFTEYGGDDTDYCLRVQKAGYKLMVTPKVHIQHGFGDDLNTSTWKRLHPEGLGDGLARMEQVLADRYKEDPEVNKGIFQKAKPDRPFCCEVQRRQWERANKGD